MRNYFGISIMTTNEEVSRKTLSIQESVWGLFILAIQVTAFMTQLQNTKEWWVSAGRPPALCNESILQETNMKLSLSKC